jgi:hypothetical protein
MATTPTLRAKLDAGAWTTGAITATYSQTVSLSLASTAGYNSIRWEIYGFPPSWPCPAGWTEDPDNRIYYAITDGSPPDAWDLPAAGTWGKWLLAAFPTADPTARDIATAIEIVSPNGLHATPAHEGAQFGGAYEAWGKDVESNWRVVDGLAAGTPAILAATEADLTAADSSSVANGTRAYVASHRSVWRKQTGDGTGLTAHERIVGYTDGHVWQRELVRSAYYELQPEWWVDPDAGSDEATGADDTHPIKTLRELIRRVAPDGVWHVSRAIAVHVGNNYVGSTLPDITFHTGTGAVTVSFVGWEADPTVHTQYTVDSAVAPVPSTNQRDTATMTAAVSDWTVGDIVRDESNNGGDAYFTVGFIDVGVPERVELCQGTDSVIGDVVIDPEAADTFRRVELAPLTIGGIRVIGGVPISIALCNVDSAGAPTSAIEGVKFIACKLANVWLGPGSSASGCSIGSNCRAMGSRDSADAEYASLFRCCLNNIFRVTTHVDLYECYLRSAVYLQRYASVAVSGPCQVHLSAVHGSVFSLNDYAHEVDMSTQYSLYGSAPHVVAVASQVVGGLIRMLSDGTSVAFASTESDMVYSGTGEDWQVFYPRPDGAVAANYPAPADIIDFANWVAAPFNGQLARNRYCDLMIVPVEPAS